MTLAGMLIRAAAMPVYRSHESKIVLLLALAVIAAFALPPILLTPGKRVIWRLWRQPILTQFVFGMLLAAAGGLMQSGIAENLARWAERLGGHDYTVLNCVGPALQIAEATLAASWLGLAWAQTHDRHARAPIVS